MTTQTVNCPECHSAITHQTAPNGRSVSTCPQCGSTITGAAFGDRTECTDASNSRVETDSPHNTLAMPPGIPTPGQYHFLAPSQQDDEIGRLGPYRVLAPIGAGGMGAVFRAEDPGLQREIALKVMLPEYAANPDARRRFLREARAQAKVQHEHVVPIFQVGEDGGVPFLAMPLLKGMSLQEALHANRRPPISEVLRIGREIAEGLSAAHEQGLIHRDIKPANIWLEGKRLRVRILDFGLARNEDANFAPLTQLTTGGMVLGTPAYMSPEQARKLTLDFRSDLFSLGIVLYEMCTGVLPFESDSLVGLLTALAVETPQQPSELNPAVPPLLSALVMRLLAKKPADRPQSAEQVVAEIRSIETANGGPAQMAASLPMFSLPIPVAQAAPEPFEAFAVTEPTPSLAPVEPVQVPKPSSRSIPAYRQVERREIPVWLIAGIVIFAVGLALGFMVNQFTPKKAEEATQSAAPEPPKTTPKPKPPAVAVTADPDRMAAEYVTSIGGRIHLVGDNREITLPGDIPRDAFWLKDVILLGNRQLSDAGMAAFKGCKHVMVISLQLTPVSDAGLAHLKDCKDIQVLDVCSTAVTDTGLGYFKDCESLEVLLLAATQVTDKGISQFKSCKNLRVVNVLRTGITDAGLDHFMKAENLLQLDLRDTQVSEKKIDELKEALPRCKITWNGGTIEPRMR
ncbi:MAG: hypothetical protein C0467_16335 [Planctomycetaceae bacterium]|nr:hypothetical protein [Planctomycetaceae bacterium]